MKKIFIFLFVALFATMYASAATVTLDFSAQGYTNAQVVTGGTIDANISWSATRGGTNDPTYYDTGTGLRVYNGGTFVVTPSNGVIITNITLTFSAAGYTFNAADANPTVWTGSTDTGHTFNVGRTSRLQIVEVTYTDGAPLPTEPLTGAPVPTYLAANVVSVFSNTYTAASWSNWGNWGQSTVRTTVQIGGNDTWKLTNFNYMGLEFAGAGGNINVSGMDSLYINVWTADATSFNVGLPDPTIACVPLVQGVWNTFKFSLAELGTNITSVGQIKFDGGDGTSTVYVDNIFFFKEGSRVVAPVISPAGGYLFAPTMVTITCATDGAAIYYTEDGSTPTTSSNVYSAPFSVSAPATIKAFAVKTDMTDSNVSTVTFMEATDPLLLDDFEGANKGWTTVGSYQDIRNNAYPEGLNQSAKVLFTNRGTGSDNWSGAILGNAGLGGIQIAGYRYLHAKMYRNNTNVPNLKINDGCGGDILPMTGITIVADEWQDVVFDLGSCAVDILMLMVDRSGTLAAEAWMLVDDIILSNDPTPRVYVAPEEPLFIETCGESGTTANPRINIGSYDDWDLLAADIATYSSTAGNADVRQTSTINTHVWFPANSEADMVITLTDDAFDIYEISGISLDVSTNASNANAQAIGTNKIRVFVGESLDDMTELTVPNVPFTGQNAYSNTGQIDIPAGTSCKVVRLLFTVANNPANYGFRVDNIAFYGTALEQPDKVATPVISPEGGEVTDPVTVTIICATEGATIYYTKDGSTPSASSIEYTGTFLVEETTTVKAIAVKAGMVNSGIASETYTFQEEEEGKTYALITSEDDLIAGEKYLIVSGQSGTVRALGVKAANNRNRPVAGNTFTVSSGSIVATPATEATDTDNPFEITLGGSSGVWTLFDAVNNGYLESQSTANNYLQTNATSTATWTISFNAGAAVLTGSVNNTNNANVIRYNSGNSMFSCYVATGQAAVYLFKDTSLGTSIAQKTIGDVKVFATDNTIFVQGADNEAEVAVHDLTGRLVVKTNATAIPLNVKGIYIVKVNNQAFKVINK